MSTWRVAGNNGHGIALGVIRTGLMIGSLLGIFLFRKGEGNMPFLLYAGLCLIDGVTVAQAGWLCVSRIAESRRA